MSARAVVFAYHDVGARCLSVLLAAGLDVALVATHRDDPAEGGWFASVARLAREHGLEVDDALEPPAPALERRVRELRPDFVFSFYYRRLLPAGLLACARRGAFNMHGSLLPRYRGRAPVNWAILRGERETGATLHEMVERADAGPVVDRMAVPILPDDQALDVLRKVTVAAELVLHRSLPGLLDGSAPRTAQDEAQASYHGARRPEDGRIDFSAAAREIHDLVRAVAPPWPGAFADIGGSRLRLLRTRLVKGGASAQPARLAAGADGALLLHCADGGVLQVLAAELDGEPLTPERLAARFGQLSLALGKNK